MDAAVKAPARLRFDNSFARLAEGLHARVKPASPAGARIAAVSPAAAALLDLDAADLREPLLAAALSGQATLPGADPVAMCYAGHQFGHYVPQLGDGRAIILGEAVNGRGERWELQLKGAGLTPFSRDGDGRAVLRSTVREFLCSEAMHALGIPTTRALCMFDSDEPVYRERVERGALLVRMAPSHVRFGSFEVFYYRQQFAQLRQLGDYVVAHDFPHLRERPNPWLDLLQTVVGRTARLIAQWQLVGFAHGVMNTDNMSILGLTLDYGPFGFMDAYDPGYVCNHSDYHGRYAFDRQPSIGLWNLHCMAQAMLPLIDGNDGEAAAEQARAALAAYEPAFQSAYATGMRAKLGLSDSRPEDASLGADLLDLMSASGVDYTNLFRDLAGLRVDDAAADAPLRDHFADPAAFDAWATRYRTRLRREESRDDARAATMRAVNPRYVLRNYLAQQAIDRAEQGDYGEIERLLQLLSRPYDDQPGMQRYAAAPPDWGRGLEISCSS